MTLGGPDLIRWGLEEKSFLWLLAEGEVRDLKHEKDSTCHYWLEDGAAMWLGTGGLLISESRPWLTANKDTETSVLQSQGTGFYQQKWAGK